MFCLSYTEDILLLAFFSTELIVNWSTFKKLFLHVQL
jgi:hypothetical protein